MTENIDIYFSTKYGEIYEKNGEGKLEQFKMKSKNGDVKYTFLKRAIENNLDQKYFDIITPYGYGGPVFKVADKKLLKDLVSDFKEVFELYCKENNIVSEFVRFHPLVRNYEEMDTYMEVSNIRNTICLDLSSEEDIWSNISSKCRNMIRKAEKNNVTIEMGSSRKDLDIFYNLYINTMKKNNALDYYLFDYSFFENTMELLSGKITIFKAVYNEKVISAALIMYGNDFIHYHFSGSDIECNKLAANNLLLYRVAIWGHKQGFKQFHLGGGYSGNEDTLFKFKKSFYKGESKDFYIGKKIHNTDIYNKLVDKVTTERNINKNYFPLYRG